MAEIPVERNTKSGLSWWLIPLLLLLLLLPLLWFMSRGCNTAVVDNTNGNSNRTIITTNANNSVGNMRNTGNVAVVANAGNNNAAFDEAERIRQANERARLAMEKFYPNGTPQQVIEVLNLSNINFATNSLDIPEANKPLLRQAAEILKKSPADTRVEINGYTDNEGDPRANQILSERRANSVRAELIRYGVPAAMLSTKGFGEEQPKASNDTPEGRFENRRIEYKVATGDATAEKVAPNSNADGR